MVVSRNCFPHPVLGLKSSRVFGISPAPFKRENKALEKVQGGMTHLGSEIFSMWGIRRPKQSQQLKLADYPLVN
jgi:hypothetical protein